MSKALRAILELEEIEVNLFRGKNPNPSLQWVFGGQLIAQSLMAASRTVGLRMAHSLHAYFIRPGDPKVPIIYKTEDLRDGKSYSIRRVTAIQHGMPIFSVMFSFHAEEQSAFDHQAIMANVPPPEELTDEKTLSKRSMLAGLSKRTRRRYGPNRPIQMPSPQIELRAAEIGRNVGQKTGDGRVHLWIRITEDLPDDPALQMCALAYASDWSLLDAIMARYGRTLLDGRMLAASLDHAMWFHRPFRVDDWLLYAQESPSAQGGRGLARGMIFTRDGTLVASVAQEGLVRERR
ncbi:acyl-CoA thioesterase II [Bradyrhizobium sp. CB2312]|uniref:acyl-CoA thioesterase n=1 Tax=Bradyrhizobium sp. CB2312 TaxID=3039155 RepID=UPI0024B0E15A|nr:acyl-CoA thioesterase II [Bradyrhizobium sp. CB2312]WFU71285.1 acyl-CoA thioesterase II [Bradyrhizobium sp. CB2312]